MLRRKVSLLAFRVGCVELHSETAELKTKGYHVLVESRPSPGVVIVGIRVLYLSRTAPSDLPKEEGPCHSHSDLSRTWLSERALEHRSKNETRGLGCLINSWKCQIIIPISVSAVRLKPKTALATVPIICANNNGGTLCTKPPTGVQGTWGGPGREPVSAKFDQR